MQDFDAATIHNILEHDRVWAAYALGDLSPELAAHCEWFVSPGPPAALLLLFRAFDPPVLFAQGDSDALTSLVAQVTEPIVTIQARRDLVPSPRAMWRMALDGERATVPGPVTNTSPLGLADLSDLRALYADGLESGDAPDCFHDSMIERGIYHGVREGDALIAAAGTHLVSAANDVCAIGNVYTRRDRRRRGLGTRVTRAVVSDAIARRCSTIVLNVAQDNDARHIYEHIGFRRHCELLQGTGLLRRGTHR
jgi:ribosomal protein S18 acetylase RimI-like enzyme